MNSGPNESSAALEFAVGKLSKRECSERRLRDDLASAGFSGPAISFAVERLKSQRILDDRRFAFTLAQVRSAKGIGPERLRSELLDKGVDGSTVDEVLESVSGGGSQLAEEALRRWACKRKAANQATAWRFLASRGFGESDIEHAVARVLGAESEPQE